MPFSLDRQPSENEIECANCGALIYYELTRCPKCGVNLYEPDEEATRTQPQAPKPRKTGRLERLGELYRRLAGKPSAAEELFGAFIRQQDELYHSLLLKVGGDPATVERLVDFERQRLPGATRADLLRNAIQRWDDDNLKP